MRIIEINVAEFGCLKNKKITLEQGINVIYGENESGKSTLMLFIKFMLYGLPKRTAKGTDRQRALSWDNNRASGSMTVEHEGKRYLLERVATGSTRTSESCKITDLATGEQLAADAGELLLGVPCEIFESSCFVSQMRTSDINRAGASSAIENILASADESIDVSHILERMDKVRKEYRLNRGDGGLLYRTEREIGELKTAYREATERHLKYNDMESRLSRVRKSIEKTRKAHEASSNMLEDVSRARILQRFEELDRKKEHREALTRSLGALEDTVRFDGFVPDRAYVEQLRGVHTALEGAEQRLQQRRREYEEMPTPTESELTLAAMGERISDIGGKRAAMSEIGAFDKRSRICRKLGVAALCVGVACGAGAAAVFALLGLGAAFVGLGAGALALIATGIALLASSGKAKKNRDALCGQYGVPFESIDEYFDSCIEALCKRDQLSAQALAARTRYESAKEDREAELERLREVLGKSAALVGTTVEQTLAQIERLQAFCDERDKLGREIYATDTLIENSEHSLSEYDREALAAAVRIDVATLSAEMVERAKYEEGFHRKSLETLGNQERVLSESLAGLRGSIASDPMDISDRIRVLEQQLERDTEYYDALMLAKEHLERASENMRGSVTPEISRRAGELMTHISEGAYAAVQTTKELDVSVVRDGFLVDAALLSAGTRDAAYLCLRISLMLRLFEKELPPLMLDEALSQLDDTRAARVLSVLSRLSDTAQCILFSCHKREAELCEDMGIRASIVRL